MFLALVVLQGLVKVVLVIVVAATRYIQYSIIHIETAKWVGDMLIGGLFLGVLFTVIEGRVVVYLMALMCMSTTVVVDYVIAGQMGWDEERSKGKLVLAQVSYLVEFIALFVSHQNGSWGTTELNALQSIAHLLGS